MSGVKVTEVGVLVDRSKWHLLLAGFEALLLHHPTRWPGASERLRCLRDLERRFRNSRNADEVSQIDRRSIFYGKAGPDAVVQR